MMRGKDIYCELRQMKLIYTVEAQSVTEGSYLEWLDEA